LLDIHVIHVEERAVFDDVVAISKAEEISGGDTIDLIEGNILPVPTSVKQTPTVCLFEGPRSINVLVGGPVV